MAILLKSKCKGRILVAACVSLAVCASCSDEEMMKGNVEPAKLSFGIALTNEWNVSYASSAESRTSRHEAFQFEDSDLWIISSEEDSIHNASFGRKPATRGAAVNADNFYKSFGVYGYVFAGSGSWKENQNSAKLYMNGEVTQGADMWSTASPHFWPGSQYSLKFFAYAPYGIGQVSDYRNQPRIVYEVPPTATQQMDLLIAHEIETATADDGNSAATYSETVAGDYGKPAKLHFYHALTAIKMRADAGLEDAITKVALKGIRSQGTHVFGSNSWTLTFNKYATFYQELDAPVDVNQENENGMMVIDGETTFMMIPQTLEKNASIEVTFNDGTVLTASLSGKKWPIGKTVIYHISKTEIIEEPYFEVTAKNTSVSYNGGALQYTVKSYIKRTTNGQEKIVAAPWRITGYKTDMDGEWSETAPEWLSITNNDFGNGVNSTNGSEQKQLTVQQQSSRCDNPQNEVLKNADRLSGVYDLSTRGGETLVNTANCYTVNAAGMYSLPLVYGNAVKDGITNESAYKTTNAGTNILSTFINHLGREISSPYIYENEDGNGDKLRPETARLLWQDAKDLVTEVTLSEDRKELKFTVAKETIQQGNAVVAVIDDMGQIMWSWHIWVTDYNPYTIETTSDFLSRYVGWCYNESTIYDPRKVIMRFEQTGTGQTAELEFTQAEHIIADGNNTYYQFGRKDPQLPATTTQPDATNKTWYNENEESTEWPCAQEEWRAGKPTIMNCILNPEKFCITFYMEKKYLNLWSMDNTDTNRDVSNSVKTIYDPSPAGYKIPVLVLLSSNYDSDTSPYYKSGCRHPRNGFLMNVNKEFDVYSCVQSAIGIAYGICNSSKPKYLVSGNGCPILPVRE